MEMRTISMESQIYHQMRCRYINSIKEKNLIMIPKIVAELQGYRACKCCNTMKYQYKIAKKVIERFEKNKGMQFLFSRNALFIKAGDSCWKLVYLPEIERLGLYHRNDSPYSINFEQPWKERYHAQKDRFRYTTIESALLYIYEHEKFYTALKRGEKSPKVSSKKYKNSAKRAIRRYERKRLDALFDLIKQQREISNNYC